MTSTATGLGGVDEIIVTGDGADYVIAGVGADRVNYILDPTLVSLCRLAATTLLTM